MEFTISGFAGGEKEERGKSCTPETGGEAAAPRRSVVQVRFPGWERTLAYYNDRNLEVVQDFWRGSEHKF